MSPGTVHQRLIERALAGKYDLFRGLGGGLAVLGLILFIVALGSDDAPRAWQLFHVNGLYFTGLAGGSVAFAAVQKITNARWSGLVSVYRLGVSRQCECCLCGAGSGLHCIRSP